MVVLGIRPEAIHDPTLGRRRSPTIIAPAATIDRARCSAPTSSCFFHVDAAARDRNEARQ